jgi:hypothetical protein
MYARPYFEMFSGSGEKFSGISVASFAWHALTSPGSSFRHSSVVPPNSRNVESLHTACSIPGRAASNSSTRVIDSAQCTGPMPRVNRTPVNIGAVRISCALQFIECANALLTTFAFSHIEDRIAASTRRCLWASRCHQASTAPGRPCVIIRTNLMLVLCAYGETQLDFERGKSL